MRASKACNDPLCPNLQPCEKHPRKSWQGSTRRQRTVSGSRQQSRARFVMYRDETICHVCGRPGSNEVDHIKPLAEGGRDNVENMAPIHKNPCHAEKTKAEAQRARGLVVK